MLYNGRVLVVVTANDINDIEEARLQYIRDQAEDNLGPAAATTTASAPPTPAAKRAAKQAVNKIIDSISDDDTGELPLIQDSSGSF